MDIMANLELSTDNNDNSKIANSNDNFIIKLIMKYIKLTNFILRVIFLYYVLFIYIVKYNLN